MERRHTELFVIPLSLLLMAAVTSNGQALEQPIGQFVACNGRLQTAIQLWGMITMCESRGYYRHDQYAITEV
jgi:hypothetical protein